MTTPASACEDCAFHNVNSLKRLGIDTTDVDYVIALAGNPNTGKSTVFTAYWLTSTYGQLAGQNGGKG